MKELNYQHIIDEVYKQILQEDNKGELADYIPELSKVNPDQFGVSLLSIDGESYNSGDSRVKFSIQSLSKVFALCLMYGRLSGKIWKRVGVEPSGTPFNSLIQIESDNGIPRNPLINAGSMVICDMIIEHYENPRKSLIDFILEVSELDQLRISQEVIDSEKRHGFRNAALINLMKSFGNIHNAVDEVLDLYYTICAIEMSCQELAQAFFFLSNNGRTRNNKSILSSSQTKRINAILQSCGFYDEAGEFSYKVGLPGKSGVGGGIIAIHPNKYSVAVFSPKLNPKGNSYRGVNFLEAFTTKSELSIF